MIQKDIDLLESEKSNSIKKHNILKLLENIGAIFTGTYLHYREVPKKTIVERNIVENVKLKRRRIPEIEQEEKTNYKLLNEYFMNCQVQVIGTKNYAQQKVNEMRIKYM